MTTMNILLPDHLKEWVTAQETSGKYNNASEYMHELIRRDQELSAQTARLQTLVIEGLDSGVSPLSVDDVFARARQRNDSQKAV